MVTDIAENSGNNPGTVGERLSNLAEIEFGSVPDFKAKSLIPLSRADEVEILEPDLKVEKDVATYTDYDPGNPPDDNIGAPNDAGDIIVFTINVEHTGNRLETSLDGGVDLLIGDSLELIISTKISQGVYPADEIENQVDLSWTSINGDRTNVSNFVTVQEENKERTPPEYFDSTESPVITVPDPQITKELVDTDLTDSANDRSRPG